MKAVIPQDAVRQAVDLLYSKHGKLKQDRYCVYLHGGASWCGNELVVHDDELFELKDTQGLSLFFVSSGVTGIAIEERD